MEDFFSLRALQERSMYFMNKKKGYILNLNKWEEAVKMACYVIDRCMIRSLLEKPHMNCEWEEAQADLSKVFWLQMFLFKKLCKEVKLSLGSSCGFEENPKPSITSIPLEVEHWVDVSAKRTSEEPSIVGARKCTGRA
ncbi:hypothetical protein HAX54_019360, partial [Datura stramonium]|nr:hypothetical protein [Datura stramonium]